MQWSMFRINVIGACLSTSAVFGHALENEFQSFPYTNKVATYEHELVCGVAMWCAFDLGRPRVQKYHSGVQTRASGVTCLHYFGLHKCMPDLAIKHIVYSLVHYRANVEKVHSANP